MTTNNLFLLECQVGTITFEPTFTPIPTRKQLGVNLRFSNIIHGDINPEDDFPTSEEDSGEAFTIDMGISFLFFYGPRNLTNEFQQSPLNLALEVDYNKCGKASLKWSDDFKEMVRLLEKIGVVKAVDQHTEVEFLNTTNEVIAKANVSLRFSCFGETIETKYQIKTVDEKKEYYFKNPKTATVFKCEGYGPTLSTVVPIPIACLYDPAQQFGDNRPDDAFSWAEIFGANEETVSKLSEMPFTKDEEAKRYSAIPLTSIFQQSSAGAISICMRPPENKYIDFINLVSTEVRTNTQEARLTFMKGKPKKDEEDEEKENPLELTADKIGRKLCKNKDCPGVKKFKEFGIGPLATGKGLGSLYGDVEPPVEYGLSHTYGSMSNYGPYGVYSRPKRLDECFIPSKNALETQLPLCPNPKGVCCKKKKEERRRCPYDTLRLRGGGEEDANESEKVQSKSPFKECKSVMDQLDQILTAYKSALGPCGQVTCPFAHNVAVESCKKFCEKSEEPKEIESVPCPKDPCEIDECPYAEKPKYPAGCGSAKCAYAKYKLGLTDDDAALELQFLPPAVAGKCGRPKCPYPLQPVLPPIHWECPDPLPKGACKNPNCPFLPPDLKKLKCPPPKRGPCGSTDCPYAIPPPCELPTCPFRQNPCPSTKKKDKKSKKDDGEELCGNPDCPYANFDDGSSSSSSSSEDSDVKGKFVACANPTCPFAKKPKPECKIPPCCGNPYCPLAQPPTCPIPTCPFAPKPEPKICGNPHCPFTPKPKSKSTNDICFPKCKNAQQSETEDQDVCENPTCPFAKSQKSKSGNNVCDKPTCPFAPKPKPHICGNPTCPFAPKPQPQICNTPTCPFAPKPEPKICDIPTCPFAPKPQQIPVCDVPTCPFAPKPKKKSLCGNPDCLYAEPEEEPCYKPPPPVCPGDPQESKRKPKKSSNVCNYPECPFNKKSSSSSSESESSSSSSGDKICGNPECPFAPKQNENLICNDPFCPYMQPLPSCGIPNCPYEPIPVMFVDRSKLEALRSRLNNGDNKTDVEQAEPPAPQEAPPPAAATAEAANATKSNGTAANIAQDGTVINDQQGEEAGEGDGKQKGKGKRKSKELDNRNGNGKRKKRGKFVYCLGDKYPGVKIGHKECLTPFFRVPAKMGWLWNIYTPCCCLKPRRGWKPGALTRSMAAKIKEHRLSKGLGMLQVPNFKKRKGRGGGNDSGSEVTVSPKPTLQIQKKDGAYWITMNPLKDPKTLAENENPYMECTPMQFRITKNKKNAEGDENESQLCCCEDENGSSSSSDSELDIEFTPPAGIINPERFRKKPNVVHCDTQYDPKDFAVKKGKGKKDKGKREKKDKKDGKGKK